MNRNRLHPVFVVLAIAILLPISVSAGSLIQEQKLIAADLETQNHFGQAVAIDGDTAVVGAPWHDNGALQEAGAAYVFTRNGSLWTQQQMLEPNDLYGNGRFGRTVAISGDTIVVGCPYEISGGTIMLGAVYVFVRSGSTWSLQQKLQPTDIARDDAFGTAVAIDGDTLVATSRNDLHSGGTAYGSATVFVRMAGVWTEQQTLIAGDHFSPDFGYSLAIDGDTIAAGAHSADFGGATSCGAVYVFTRSAGVWSLEQKVGANDAAEYDQLGTSVDLHGDTLVVGASSEDPSGVSNAGSAYVFVRSGVTWSQQQKLNASDSAANTLFGLAVTVQDNDVVVAAPDQTFNGVVQAGAAYAFTRTAGIWSERQKIGALDAEFHDRFGESVNLDSGTVIVGAWLEDPLGVDEAGSAYVFAETTSVDLSISKDDSLDTAVPGQTDVTYSITASNAASEDDADGAIVGDVFPHELEGCSWSCVPTGAAECTAGPVAGDILDTVIIPAGDSVTYTATCSLASWASGTLDNTAIVTAPMGMPDVNLSNNTATDSTTLTPIADLSITKDDGLSVVAAGNDTIYTMVAGNSGPSDAYDAVVSDMFGFGLVDCNWSCSGAGGATCTTGPIEGDIADTIDLPVGGTATYTATCTVHQAMTSAIANSVDIAPGPSTTDPNAANDTADDTNAVVLEVDLVITKSDASYALTPGSSTTYAIGVTNLGPSDAVSAEVTDNFPAELENCSWSCAASLGANCTTGPVNNDINDVVTVRVGADLTYTATCDVLNSPGIFTNTATIAEPISATELDPSNNTATDTDEIVDPVDLIFDDGFESGDTDTWSSSTP